MVGVGRDMMGVEAGWYASMTLCWQSLMSEACPWPPRCRTLGGAREGGQGPRGPPGHVREAAAVVGGGAGGVEGEFVQALH